MPFFLSYNKAKVADISQTNLGEKIREKKILDVFVMFCCLMHRYMACRYFGDGNSLWTNIELNIRSSLHLELFLKILGMLVICIVYHMNL